MMHKCHVLTIYRDGKPLYVRLASVSALELGLVRTDVAHELFSTSAPTYHEAADRARVLLDLCAQALHDGPIPGISALTYFRCDQCSSHYPSASRAKACVACHTFERSMQALADEADEPKTHLALIARGRWPKDLEPIPYGPSNVDMVTVRWCRMGGPTGERWTPVLGFEVFDPTERPPPLRPEFLREYLRLQTEFFRCERARSSGGQMSVPFWSEA